MPPARKDRSFLCLHSCVRILLLKWSLLWTQIESELGLFVARKGGPEGFPLSFFDMAEPFVEHLWFLQSILVSKSCFVDALLSKIYTFDIFQRRPRSSFHMAFIIFCHPLLQFCSAWVTFSDLRLGSLSWGPEALLWVVLGAFLALWTYRNDFGILFKVGTLHLGIYTSCGCPKRNLHFWHICISVRLRKGASPAFIHVFACSCSNI